jgi:streptogramin lyase
MRLQFTMAFVVVAVIAPSIFGGSIPGITVTTIPNPPSFSDLVTGPDRNIWFTAWKENAIGRITPGPNFTLFPLPAPNSVPVSITLGVDGNLWFTEQVALGASPHQGRSRSSP